MPNEGSEKDVSAGAPCDSSGELTKIFFGMRLPHDMVKLTGLRDALYRRTMTAFPSRLGMMDVATTSFELIVKSDAGSGSRSAACRTSNGWLCSIPRR